MVSFYVPPKKFFVKREGLSDARAALILKHDIVLRTFVEVIVCLKFSL